MYSSIACIGFGNMGEGLLRAIAQAFPLVRLTVLEKDATKAQNAKDSCNAQIADSLEALLASSEAIILAIKPQDAKKMLETIRSFNYQGHLLSIMGGKTSAWIAEQSECKLVARFMPSLSANVGVGAVALCFNPSINAETTEAQLLFSSSKEIANVMGVSYEIPEHLMGAFTGISGSGIAYAWSFIHGLAMGGVQNGLPYQTSLSVVCDMVLGAATYIKTKDEHPVSMLTKVCSPGGTTIEGMHALDSAGFQGICMDAVSRTVKRSKELEG